MGDIHTVLQRLADGLTMLADEIEAERVALHRRLAGMHWRGLAAEAVRGVLSDRLCALAEARERHLEAAEALHDHARFVESRQRLLDRVAHVVDSLIP